MEMFDNPLENIILSSLYDKAIFLRENKGLIESQHKFPLSLFQCNK